LSFGFANAERIEELEATIKALEEDLEESGKEAAEVVEHWQESHNALEARVEGLETENAALEDEVRSLREMSESQFGSQASVADVADGSGRTFLLFVCYTVFI